MALQLHHVHHVEEVQLRVPPPHFCPKLVASDASAGVVATVARQAHGNKTSQRNCSSIALAP
eukprot:8732447-Alexandrium_andersonii.AAC.1